MDSVSSKSRLLGLGFLTVVLILTVFRVPVVAANRTNTTRLFCKESSSCASMVVGATSFPGTITTLPNVGPEYLLDREGGQGDSFRFFALVDGGGSAQAMQLMRWSGAAPLAPVGQSGYMTTPIISLYQGTNNNDDNNHVVPEPGSMVLLLSGFLALGGYLRRGRKGGEIRSS